MKAETILRPSELTSPHALLVKARQPTIVWGLQTPLGLRDPQRTRGSSLPL